MISEEEMDMMIDQFTADRDDNGDERLALRKLIRGVERVTTNDIKAAGKSMSFATKLRVFQEGRQVLKFVTGVIRDIRK